MAGSQNLLNDAERGFFGGNDYEENDSIGALPYACTLVGWLF
jgi:hypothetical protein